ncbi:hypothetical protein CBW65_20235 [Tumebacillus avium]|uniref:Uncharacterized protein n=1 Tax=Tumebacillus avium TaxID=1903704 RepID=A0A1Y0IQY5_9BACL|nr:hypothetical protein [Tumebacillus avium]ARU63042.1 hypothetical protein CBW65_20235 [Tumebacillus avium]
MTVVYATDSGERLFVTETNDLAGLITAIKESDTLIFDQRQFKLESMLLNHHTEDGYFRTEFMVYIDEIITI